METLKILLNIIVIAVTTPIIVINLRDLRRGYTFAFLFIYPAFYVFCVVPAVIHTFFGTVNYFFYRANYAMSDDASVSIYLAFILVASIVFVTFYNFTKKKYFNNNGKIYAVDTNREDFEIKFKNRQIVKTGMFIATFMPVIYFIISPSYWYLLSTYGAGYLYEAERFPKPLIIFGGIVAIVCLMIINNKIMTLIVCMNLFFCLFIVGSRSMIFTTVVFTAFALLISHRVTAKKVINVLVIAIPFLIAFALWYQGVYKPSDTTLYRYWSVDLSRDYTTIYTIYCELTDHMILNYRGETILADLIFWIPRNIFPLKPYPFAQHITIDMLNADIAVGELGWSTTTNIFAEFTANFGLIGLPLGIAFVQLLIHKIDRVLNIEIKLVLIYILFMLITVEFQAIAVGVVAILALYIVLSVLQKFFDASNKKRMSAF